MIRRNRSCCEILGQFWDRLEITPDDQDWLSVSECELRRVPDSVHEILDELAEEFGRDELVASGIASQDGEGVLNSSVQLPCGVSVMRLVHEVDCDLPFDLLSPHGIVLGEEVPAYATAHDYKTTAALQTLNEIMLMMPTLADVVASRALGVAAVPSVGIERSNIDGLRQIEELKGMVNQLRLPSADDRREEDTDVESVTTCSQGSTASEVDTNVEVQGTPDRTTQDDGCEILALYGGGERSVELIIAGWSFARQRRVPGEQLRLLMSRLADAERYLRIDLSHVAVWVPTDDEIAGLQFCMDLQDSGSVVNALVDSVGRSTYSISSVESEDLSPWRTPDTYLEARSALWRSLRDTASDSADRDALVESFENLLQSQMIDPLLQAAVGNTDPVLGTLRIEFANISSLLQSQAPFLHHDLIQANVHAESRDRRGTLDRSIRLRMQLVDRLIRIARELRR